MTKPGLQNFPNTNITENKENTYKHKQRKPTQTKTKIKKEK